jgi:hypothetical protein
MVLNCEKDIEGKKAEGNREGRTALVFEMGRTELYTKYQAISGLTSFVTKVALKFGFEWAVCQGRSLRKGLHFGVHRHLIAGIVRRKGSDCIPPHAAGGSPTRAKETRK